MLKQHNKIVVLIVYVQRHPLNMNAEVSSEVMRQRCGLRLNLHSYSVDASSKVSGVDVRKRKLA